MTVMENPVGIDNMKEEVRKVQINSVRNAKEVRSVQGIPDWPVIYF
jgi:hypothetical protein